MQTLRFDQVNPLVRPALPGDCIIAASGERYFVRDNMRGEYWLQHASGFNLTHPVSGQVELCRQINQLADI